jgi:hypothetical protein
MTEFVLQIKLNSNDRKNITALQYKFCKRFCKFCHVVSSDIRLNFCFTRAVRVHKFIGDTTGVLHVGPQQTVIGQFADEGEFEINTYVYQDGMLHLPKSFLCREIQITNR